MITENMNKISNIPHTPSNKVESMRDDFASARALLLEERKLMEENYNKMAHDFQGELDSLNDRIAMLNRALDDYPQDEMKTMSRDDREQIHYGSMGNG